MATLNRQNSQGFNCGWCHSSLGGHKFLFHENVPTCLSCYESRFAATCSACKRPIGVGSKKLSLDNVSWHEGCFKCARCNRDLIDKEFGLEKGKPFCPPCHELSFGQVCTACNQVFHNGDPMLQVGGGQYHHRCFVCSQCKQPIGTNSFVPDGGTIFCQQCYINRRAERCCRCSQPIVSGGFNVEGRQYHGQCFTCEFCHRPLSGQKMSMKEGRLMCADCVGQHVAKQCCKCQRPIMGELAGQNPRYTTFENKDYHTECFRCDRCVCELSGVGFFRHSDERFKNMLFCASCIQLQK